ncbi:MAG TPA: hypothetical protein VKG78_01390 [Opitutaceae bacterium]|nr:hypothetical protein [Opitutaceae bacterium]
MMSDSGQSVAACEDCGARTETTGGWNRPSGVAGSASTFTQTVQRADHMLGHPGYLCTRHWWARARAAA